jgi:uncharacterized protein (TIGR00288 family)
LNPWWLRPSAEGATNEEQKQNPQAQEPSPPPLSSTPSGSAPAETPLGAPQGASADEPVAPVTSEAHPSTPPPASPLSDLPPSSSESSDGGPQEWPRWERPRAPQADAPVASVLDVLPAGDALDEELVEGEENGAETEEKDEEGRPRRRRSRRGRGGRRKNGRTVVAGAPETAEEEEDEAEESPSPGPQRIVRTAEPLSPPSRPQRDRDRESYVIPAGDLDNLNREIVISVPDRGRSVQDERKIAVFCDLENIALGVRDSEIGKFDILLVLERLLEKGKIIVKKAYADWERYSEYKRPFHEAAIELIDIPQKYYSGKNSADIKMVVDAMDMSYAKEHLDTFVILSGDSDFSPLVSKLKENNKYVIGIGVKNSSSNLLVDNCDEFIYYEDVWRDQQAGPKLDGLGKKTSEAFSLMIDSIQALVRENKDVLWGSMIKQTMQRKKPSFNEGYYGYSTFSELLEDAERKNIVKLKKDQRSGTYIVTGFAKSTKGDAGRRST